MASTAFNVFMIDYAQTTEQYDPNHDIMAAVTSLLYELENVSGYQWRENFLEDRYCQILGEARSWLRDGLSVQDVLVWIEDGAR